MARKIGTLEPVYLEEVRDLFNVEGQSVHALPDALPEMAVAIQFADLLKAFQGATPDARRQVRSLQKPGCKGLPGVSMPGWMELWQLMAGSK